MGEACFLTFFWVSALSFFHQIVWDALKSEKGMFILTQLVSPIAKGKYIEDGSPASCGLIATDPPYCRACARG